MAQLDEGPTCKLTLLSAPAGLGKTTLLAAWCAAAQRPSPGASSCADIQLPDAPSLIPPASIVWLSLDEEDNDPVRFWTHLVTALRQSPAAFGKAALAMLEAPQPPPIQVLVSSLLNEIVETAKPLLMVLDDLHCISGDRGGLCGPAPDGFDGGGPNRRRPTRPSLRSPNRSATGSWRCCGCWAPTYPPPRSPGSSQSRRAPEAKRCGMYG